MQLRDVAEVIRGVSFDKAEASAIAIVGAVPVLRAGNIRGELDLANDLVWVPSARVAANQLLRVGDIVVCMSSGSASVVGKSARLHQEWHGSFGAFCAAIRPGRAIDSQYLALWLRSPAFQSWRDSQARGANIQNLRASQFGELQLPLPALAEQRRIAARLAEQLAAVDRALAAAHHRMEMAEGLESVHLGRIFAGDSAAPWPEARVADIAGQLDYGYTASADSSTDGPRFLRITDIQNGRVEWSCVPGCRIDRHDEVTYALADGDIVFARTGATTGKSYLIRKPPRSVFASYLIRLRLKSAALPEYVYAFFQSQRYWAQVASAARGGAQPNVNASLLGEIALPLPDLELQQRIVQQVSVRIALAARVTTSAESELAAIEALPAALLREAFNEPGQARRT